MERSDRRGFLFMPAISNVKSEQKDAFLS